MNTPRFPFTALFAVLLLFCTSAPLAAQNAGDSPTTPTKAVLIPLDSPVVEQSSPLQFFGEPGVTLRNVTDAIDQAADDPEVGALVIRVMRPMPSAAQASELNRHLSAFRDSGKPVLALSDGLLLWDYLAVSAADEIVLTPVGGLGIYGLSADMFYLAGLLEKLGMEAQVINTGEFKTALEALTHKEMSEGTRIQTNALLDTYEQWIFDTVAAGRGMSAEQAEEALWNGPYESGGALEAGLITRVDYIEGYEEAWLAENGLELVEDYGPLASKAPEPPSLMELLGGLGRSSRRSARDGDRIAVVYATGPIVDGRSDPNPFATQQEIASEDFLDLLDEVLEEGNTRAIVLRVDSPGGSAIASDRIWARLREISEDEGIPVITSMGNVAASGGYYIGMAGDTIYAEPVTITGSIGVIAGRLILGETYEEIGVNRTALRRGQYAGIVDESRAWNEDELEKLTALIEDVYTTFVTKAAESRGLTTGEIREVAGGRVWSGADALERGLVDELGGLQEAIAAARIAAEAPDAPVAVYPREMDFFEFLEKAMGGQAAASAPALPASRETALRTALAEILPEGLASGVATAINLLRTEQAVALTYDPVLFTIR